MTAPLIDDSTLGELRQIQSANMISECDLVAFVISRSAGAETDRTPVIVDTIPCRVTTTSAALPLVAAQLTPGATFLIFIAANVDLTNVARLIIRGPVAATPLWTFQLVITGILEPRSFAASTRILCTLADDIVVPPTPVVTIVINETP